MDVFLYLIKAVIYFAVCALQAAMLVRAVLSWFPDVGGRFADFLFSVTEPFIEPVRILLDRFDSLRNLPIDISFLVTFILLSFVQSLLAAFF